MEPAEAAELRRLEDEVARYRAATEALLEQLDYCADQFQRETRTRDFAVQLRKNQKSIRRRITGQ
jgi:hypothetical protein